MMTREEAIQWIKDIQGGVGVDREMMRLLVPMGRVALQMIDDAGFSYGVEYGVLLGLMVAFDLTEGDL